MERVKELVAAGLSLPEAIKQALRERELSVAAFAEKYDLPGGRSMTSEQISLARAASAAFCAALAAECGGTVRDWALLLWQHAKPAFADAA